MSETQIEKAAKVLKEGGVIVYPTETVFAVGCLLENTASVERLYKIKKRDLNQPTLAVFPNLQIIEKYVKVGNLAQRLAKAFWPGPLTICLEVRKSLPEAVLGPQRTLGVRIPDYEWLLELLVFLNEPILAPSANFKGKPPPTKLAEIDKELISLVDYVVELEPSGKRPSTIVTLDEDKRVYNINREGEISVVEIDQVLKQE